jgi:hypothetical protein
MVYENNDKRFYILEAVEHYLQIIRNCIGRYDFKEAISKFKSENEEFLAFYQLLKSQGYSVRFYTTNYDDLISLILEVLGEKPLYRGFDIDKTGKMFPNIKEILLNPDADTYYNLHGSIYWEINTNEKFEPSFMYAPGIQRAAPMAHADYTNPSERTIIYNIITGFNKLQKVSIEPLKAFFTCLSNDAIKADLIATIGYSYGDTHVNRSLGYGVKHGKAKFLHITKSDNFFGSSEFIGMLDYMMNKKNYSTDFDYKSPWITAKDNTAMIYTNGFQDFLTKKEWQRLKEFI